LFILNLHGIAKPKRELTSGERRVWIDQATFEAILDFVQARNDMSLTFDDANESDFSLALPALRARGLKAQFFLVADRIGGPDFLSSAQVQELISAGMTLGSHGMRHRPWAGLGQSELDEELVEARRRLEALAGIRINQASCPFGSYNRRVLKELSRRGYDRVFTSDGGPARPASFVSPRNSIYNTWTVETVKQLVCDNRGPLRRLIRNMKLILKRWR
jgi:peptidoglycan/xylan/chitin deacetylase (PgdA/CDA1 family)